MGQKTLKTSVTTFFLLLLLVSPATGCGGGAQADIVFVVDASGSVGSSNFQKLLEFVRDMVLSFDIGSNLIRVGLEKFESRQYVEFHLNRYYDRNAMASRVMTTYYTRGGTYTGRAINYMRDTMFNSANGDRSSAPNIGVIITDGRSNSYSETSSTSASARSRGITIFSIGVGYGYSLSELNVMATDPDSQHVFTVNDFNKMGQIKSAFATQACPPTHGNWGSWGSWSACSVTCGSGTKSHSRSCNNPAPANGGSNCAGSSTEASSCTMQSCIVHGAWSSWSSWGSCSVTCAAGTWSRSRSCTNPAPAGGGNPCAGVSGETTTCNHGPCPIDGAWGTWSAWSACSVTCLGVGVQGRTRLCDNPTPQHGGASCPGSGSETQTCDRTAYLCAAGNGWGNNFFTTTPGTPVNGGFGPWGAWSTCSKTCNNGVMMRMRQCNNPVPQFGGDVCSGAFVESQNCNNIPCPGGSAYVQTCPERFFDCRSGNTTCVHYLRKCDCIKDCDDASDENVEWAGCMTDYETCSNHANVVTPTSAFTVLLLLLATAVPLLMTHTFHRP